MTCTDKDRIEISKSLTASVAQEMNLAINVDALEVMVIRLVKPETEDKFDDEFWDGLDLCWNALDNVHARRYSDDKCNSEVVLPYKTKFLEQVQTPEGEKRMNLLKQNEASVAIVATGDADQLYSQCVRLAAAEFAELHVTRLKILIFLLPEDEKSRTRRRAR